MTAIPGVGPRTEYRQLVSRFEEVRQRVNRAELVMVSTGTVSLGTSPDTTTDVSDSEVTADSKIVLQAEDSGGAATDGVSRCYVSSIGTGTFTITHPASASARTLRYFVFG